tara:strand:+ start:310 stop:591 length:282 start_codon:yes stop_codon:yes gene_type:complete
MSNDSCLQAYLELGEDLPLSLINIETQKHSPMFTSKHLFDLFYPRKSEEDFISWRAHRQFNLWQDDIFSMSGDEFQYHWPMIAGALVEGSSPN